MTEAVDLTVVDSDDITLCSLRARAQQSELRDDDSCPLNRSACERILGLTYLIAGRRDGRAAGALLLCCIGEKSLANA